MSQPLFPDEARRMAQRRYARGHRQWLNGSGEWPLSINLKVPTGEFAAKHVELVSDWVRAWQGWTAPGRVDWAHRRWAALGNQSVPERLLFDTAEELAACAADSSRWSRARERYLRLTEQWPLLSERLCRYFDLLADYDDADLDRLTALLSWLVQNPRSGLYLRQLPLAGMDTKWAEARRGVVADLAACVLEKDDDASVVAMATSDFYNICGFKRAPALVRVRVLDAPLRAQVGGLSDLSGLTEELSLIPWQPRYVLFVENLQTLLALEEIPGAIAIWGGGYGMDCIGRLAWLADAKCIYWGDIDTHGFAILSQLRGSLPRTESLLMNEETLLAHRDLWVEEPAQHPATTLPNLTSTELSLYQKLKHQKLGVKVRLEQERINWDIARQALEMVIPG